MPVKKKKKAAPKKKAPEVVCPSCESEDVVLRMGPEFTGIRHDAQNKRWLCKSCSAPFRTAA